MHRLSNGLLTFVLAHSKGQVKVIHILIVNGDRKSNILTLSSYRKFDISFPLAYLHLTFARQGLAYFDCDDLINGDRENITMPL